MRYGWWRFTVFGVAASVPFYWLYQAWVFALGPDPGKVLVDNLGQGALVLLLLTLSATPLKSVTGWVGWVAVRRQLGLWVFTYAVLHIAGYLYFLLGLDFAQLGAELIERPYIIVGFLGFLILLVLTATSNRWSVRRLGLRWKLLHRLVYPLLLLVLLHMLWVVRADSARWVLYASIGGFLLLLRIPVLARLIAFASRKQTVRHKSEINR